MLKQLFDFNEWYVISLTHLAKELVNVACFYDFKSANLFLAYIHARWESLGVARKLIGNALPISARVGKVDLAVNLGYIARSMPLKS